MLPHTFYVKDRVKKGLQVKEYYRENSIIGKIENVVKYYRTRGEIFCITIVLTLQYESFSFPT